MWDRFRPAMRRALAATRASNPLEATRVLREALDVSRGSAGPRQTAQGESASAWPDTGQKARRGLDETLATLRDGARVAQLKPHREPPLPAGSAFLRKIISTRAGERDYRLFVPSAGKPRGLLVMLHGCKQHAEDFALGTAMNTVAEKESMLVAYPTQSNAANVSGCWNWFQPEHQERDGGEPHIIAEMTGGIIAEYGIGPRVYVAGLSAGGAMAAVMGTNYPDLYAAIGIHSGLPYRSAHDVSSAFAAMRGDNRHQRQPRSSRPSPTLPRLIVFHGTLDHTVVPQNAKELMDTVRQAHGGGVVEEQRFEAGSRFVQHSEYWGTDGMVKAEAWLIEGGGHYWSGGDPAGSYAKAEGPSASHEMMRFFLGRRRGR